MEVASTRVGSIPIWLRVSKRGRNDFAFGISNATERVLCRRKERNGKFQGTLGLFSIFGSVVLLPVIPWFIISNETKSLSFSLPFEWLDCYTITYVNLEPSIKFFVPKSVYTRPRKYYLSQIRIREWNS